MSEINKFDSERIYTAKPILSRQVASRVFMFIMFIALAYLSYVATHQPQTLSIVVNPCGNSYSRV
jgi:hypothetical protein